ncbi:phosphotransferase [Paenibacillus sp. P46E]|uniref:phosphotransferase n=1 Tax=Paenibacillus sp. P46E TaxID=1349436 RepID=UPI000A4E5FAC|nr:phosphotransferase [Paenibacillus sp. P46E]
MNGLLGMKLGEGGCAEIYEWEDTSKVIKLAKSNTGTDALAREFSNSQAAWKKGLTVPRPYELTEVDGRQGMVTERIYGESLMERFIQLFMQVSADRKWTDSDDENIRITARSLSHIHSQRIPSMPPQREALKWNIHSARYLTSDEKKRVVERLDRLPLKYQLCHGDPNPGNILIRNGEPVVIDWMNASTGNPEADLGEYIIMIRYSVLPPGLPADVLEFFDSVREHIIRVFSEEYERLTGIAYREVEQWLVPLAARKLDVDSIVEEEKQRLLEFIRAEL